MNPRGLTLVEVVIAAALLAAMVAATLPLITASPAAGPSASDVTALAAFVDEATAEWTSPADAPSTLHCEEAAAEVRVTVLPAGEEALGLWVTFECRGVCVARWMPLSEESE